MSTGQRGRVSDGVVSGVVAALMKSLQIVRLVRG
jgi:hypothetical protein